MKENRQTIMPRAIIAGKKQAKREEAKCKERLKLMGLVKTRRLAAMQKQQRAKAGMKPPKPKVKHEFDERRLKS